MQVEYLSGSQKITLGDGNVCVNIHQHLIHQDLPYSAVVEILKYFKKFLKKLTSTLYSRGNQ